MIQTEHLVSYVSDTKTENWSEFPNAFLWMMYYAFCNKIQRNLIDKNHSRFQEQPETYLKLTFKSENQLKCFLRKGQNLFPYIEFI